MLKTGHKCSSVHNTRTVRYLERERRRLMAGSSVAATNRYRTIRIMQNYTSSVDSVHTVCALITCVACATRVRRGRWQRGGCGTSRIVSNLISSHSCMPFITSHRPGQVCVWACLSCPNQQSDKLDCHFILSLGRVHAHISTVRPGRAHITSRVHASLQHTHTHPSIPTQSIPSPPPPQNYILDWDTILICAPLLMN